jgi:lysozyme
MLNKLEETYEKKPILYSTYEAYDLILANNFHNYPIWIRDVYFKPQLKDGREWTFWQYSNKTRLKGYNGNEKRIDMNVFNGDMEQLEKMIHDNTVYN